LPLTGSGLKFRASVRVLRVFGLHFFETERTLARGWRSPPGSAKGCLQQRQICLSLVEKVAKKTCCELAYPGAAQSSRCLRFFEQILEATTPTPVANVGTAREINGPSGNASPSGARRDHGHAGTGLPSRCNGKGPFPRLNRAAAAT